MSAEANGNGKPAILPWRLVRLDVRRSGSTAAELMATGAPCRLDLNLVSNIETGRQLGHLIRHEQEKAAAALAEVEKAVAEGAEAAKLAQLEEAQAKAKAQAAEVTEAAQTGFAAARRALAEGTDPSAHERAAMKARSQIEVFENRVSALAPLVAAARRAFDEARRRALVSHRAEMRTAALAEFRRVEIEAVATLSAGMTDLIRARAAYQALHLTIDDVSEDMERRHEEAVRQQMDSVLRHATSLPVPLSPPKEQTAYLDGPMDERLPEGVEPISGPVSAEEMNRYFR